GTQGRPVKIHYNPKHPEEFALTEEQAVSETIWPKFRKIAIFMIILGVLFLAAAAAAGLGLLPSLSHLLPVSE
ncbi:MAG: hypothetical protein ACSW79_08425, partial [Eubacteriales bacterium]